MDKKQLIAAAKEINEVVKPQPKIKVVAVKEDALQEQMLKALELIEDDDEFTDETLEVIEYLKEEAGETPDEEPDEEPEEAGEEPEDAEELFDEVNDCEDLKELKKMVKQHDEFKTLRKKAPGIFEIDDLRDMMLDLLEDDDDGEADTPPEEEKEKAPAKKGAAKKGAKESVKDDEPEEKAEKAEKPKKKSTASSGSHYGTAVGILCTDPDMEWDTLVKKMDKQGFHVDDGKSAMRTAFSSVRKIVSLLRENGWKKK